MTSPWPIDAILEIAGAIFGGFIFPWMFEFVLTMSAKNGFDVVSVEKIPSVLKGAGYVFGVMLILNLGASIFIADGRIASLAAGLGFGVGSVRFICRAGALRSGTVTKRLPNKSPEATPGSVTPAASAPGAPPPSAPQL